MTSSYFLKDGVSCCRTIDGAVFLDLARERYIGLPADEAGALDGIVAEWPTLPPDAAHTPSANNGNQVAMHLVELGLLTTGPMRAVTPIQPEEVASEIEFYDLLELPCHVTVRHFVVLAAAYCRARIWIKRASLAQIALKVAARRTQGSQDRAGATTSHLSDLAVIYQRLRPLLFTAKDQCLLDSLCFIEFLAHFRMYPTWVIGVKSKPFAAHSWVQQSETVLNDSAERVRQFVPIFAV